MSTLPPPSGDPRERLATIPTDGGAVFCRRCKTALAAGDAFCPSCGLARLTEETLLVQRDPSVTVIEDDVVAVADDTTPWLWLTLVALGVMALLLAIFLATNDGDDTPNTTVMTTVTTTPAPTTVVQPVPQPVIVPVPQSPPTTEAQQPQTIIVEREASTTTSAPSTTTAP